ncbi:MAG: pyridoxamine 5'-phosphate oxidase family protein [Armatimonadota bacterium]
MRQITALFAAQRLAVLATQHGGQPFGSLVAFAASDDLHDLIFATFQNTRKYRNILADARVALVMDNRTNTPADFTQATAVTVIGVVEQIPAEEYPARVVLFLTRHPDLRDFLQTPGCLLLRVVVEQYDVVTTFDQVRALHMRAV